MVINLDQSGNGFSLKNKNLPQVVLDPEQITVNDFTITDPGEYDIAGTAIEVDSFGQNLNGLIDYEGILCGILSSDYNLDQLTEDFTKVNVLFLFVKANPDVKKISSLVAKIEPQLVFYHGLADTDLSEELKLEKISENYKVSKNDLLFEGTRHLSFS